VTVPLEPHLNERRALIEHALAGYLDRETEAPAELQEAMRYSLLAPGKRLRPLLILLAAEACGGGVTEALPAACALEMVHTYSLVHDDLPAMDNDDLRRGRPTAHKQFGEATAILVGDALLTLAFQILAEDIQPADLALECSRILAGSAGAGGMVGGQMEDLAWERRGGGTPEVLAAIHRRKTGAMFQAAIRIGALVGLHAGAGGKRHATLAALADYAAELGLAFQISDDLLDVEGEAAVAGKGVGKDAARGKLTYPGLLGVGEARRLLKEHCRAARACLTSLGAAGQRLGEMVGLIEERNR
jgi:geranylgeranyl diphosphate synthase type II